MVICTIAGGLVAGGSTQYKYLVCVIYPPQMKYDYLIRVKVGSCWNMFANSNSLLFFRDESTIFTQFLHVFFLSFEKKFGWWRVFYFVFSILSLLHGNVVFQSCPRLSPSLPQMSSFTNVQGYHPPPPPPPPKSLWI